MPCSIPKTVPVGVLAGGRNRRFLSGEKTTALLGGVRLIDRVLDRLADQTENIVISAPDSFGLNMETVADCDGFVKGPAAGLYALAQRFKHTGAFLTVAVDMPFIPLNYVERMTSLGPTAVAKTGNQLHPTCGLWSTEVLLAGFAAHGITKSPSLYRLAELCNYSPCMFDDEDAFMNINTRADLRVAERKLTVDYG